MSLGAILLAGGRGSRVDGAIKPLFEIGGRTLLRAAVDAVTDAGAHPVVVAGPMLDPTLSVTWVREDPPFGGPVAGTIAALAELDDAAEWVFLLACDQPLVGRAVARLLADRKLLQLDSDGLCLADASSRPQWLTGLYRTDALRRAARGIRNRGADAPVRVLVADLAIAAIADPAAVDIDTWEDLRRFTEGAEDG